MDYAVTASDLAAGRNRVAITDRGEGRVVEIIASGRDPVGGVKVQYDNGASCSYENDKALITILGRDMTAITPWEQMAGSGEWVCLHVGPGGLAGRVYQDGTWNVYNGRGEWQEGRAATVEGGRLIATGVLETYGCAPPAPVP
jgi:hypothetical protein